MLISRQELIETRFQLAKDMNSYILNLGDEDILEPWFSEGIPDCPNDEDYFFFAENDDEWADLCSLFGSLVKESEV